MEPPKSQSPLLSVSSIPKAAHELDPSRPTAADQKHSGPFIGMDQYSKTDFYFPKCLLRNVRGCRVSLLNPAQVATCNPWRPLKVRPGRLAGGPPKGPTVSGHRLMTAKFAPEDILKPRNPAIPPQRRCFSSKSCFFFCANSNSQCNLQ